MTEMSFTFICVIYQNIVRGHVQTHHQRRKCPGRQASVSLCHHGVQITPYHGTNLYTFLDFHRTAACPQLEDIHHGGWVRGPDFCSLYKCHLRPFYPVYDLAGKQTRNNTFFFKLNDLSYIRIHLSSNTRCFFDYIHSVFNLYIYVFI